VFVKHKKAKKGIFQRKKRDIISPSSYIAAETKGCTLAKLRAQNYKEQL
jgi:hypothetical protein